jgi:DNA repair protein REV1
LGVATNEQEILAKETLSMLKALGFSPGELRGIGIQMTRLEPLKAAIGPESSQRRLQFKVGEPNKPMEKITEQQDDPIEDVVTPRKPKHSDQAAFGAVQLNEDNSPSRKPLNTLGTQFILPSQVDPSVLAELPADIRNKLAQHIGSFKKIADTGKAKETIPQATPKIFTALPAESQIDPEILDSLPEEMRSEIMAFYNKSPNRPKFDQAVLPQSPRKNRTVAPSKRSGAPLIRRRGRPGRFEVRSNANNGTLTQSNFIAPRLARQGSHDGTTTDTEGEQSETGTSAAEEMDPEFLAALPEDIRREVLDEQRRKRLEKTSKLTVAANARKKIYSRAQANQGPIERLLKLPPRPPKPTFTGRKFTTLPELREAISEWCREFREEGPYQEDTDALGTYLHKVIVEEGDMNKAVTAVKWLTWIVEEELVEEGDAQEKWIDALAIIKKGVQVSVKERGLGKVKN